MEAIKISRGGLKWHFRNRQFWKPGTERKGDANARGLFITTLFPAIKSLCGKIVAGKPVEEHGKPITSLAEAEILFQTVKSYVGIVIS